MPMPMIDATDRFQTVSTPTTCLHCHLLVQMVYTRDYDTEINRDRSFWTCPMCTKVYPGKYWKIKKARKMHSVA